MKHKNSRLYIARKTQKKRVRNKTSIVIADDNPHIRQTVVDILMDRGYAVDTVKDGFELIAYLRKKSPDILILDLMMPNKDGFEVLSAVKSIASRTKIIIYTAFQRYEHSVLVTKVDKFLLKGENPLKLLNAIKELE